MTDYSKTKIYKIESSLGDKVYVGSTAKQYLSQRFALHKAMYKRWKAGKVYKMSSYDLFDEYGPENCNIVLIEEFSCTSKDLKNAREAHFIKELNCVNKNIPGRTQKEYLKNDDDTFITYHKEYFKIHTVEHSDYMKNYRLKNADKLKEYRKEYYKTKKAMKLQSKEEIENVELIV